jgi:hypothetical protein
MHTIKKESRRMGGTLFNANIVKFSEIVHFPLLSDFQSAEMAIRVSVSNEVPKKTKKIPF